MTTRHAGYVVTLEKDIPEDDAERIITALRMVRGVLAVEPVAGNVETMIAESRARARMVRRLSDLLGEIAGGK